MPRVKLIGNGRDDFTGVMGRFEFENGISEEISTKDCEHLGALVRCELVDSAGQTTGVNPSLTQRMVDERYKPAQVKSARQTVAQMREEALQQTPEAEGEEPQEAVADDSQGLTFDFTKEQLEVMADEGGLQQLREFAKPYEVRSTSIKGLIDGLVAKQQDHLKKTADLDSATALVGD